MTIAAPSSFVAIELSPDILIRSIHDALIGIGLAEGTAGR
jgi:hypothetical protein